MQLQKTNFIHKIEKTENFKQTHVSWASIFWTFFFRVFIEWLFKIWRREIYSKFNLMQKYEFMLPTRSDSISWLSFLFDCLSSNSIGQCYLLNERFNFRGWSNRATFTENWCSFSIVKLVKSRRTFTNNQIAFASVYNKSNHNNKDWQQHTHTHTASVASC